MQRGKLVVIEGIDGVGKNTQALLLRDYIQRTKGECGFFSFPRYETESGKRVGAYLRGEMGELSILERAMLYAIDRRDAKAEMLSFLDRGVDVVCDRYVYSNAAFFTAIAKTQGMSDKDVQEIEERILTLEFEVNQLPLIDALIVLSLPEELSKQLVLNKRPREYTTDKQDLHEKQENIQIYANKYYHDAYPANIVFCNDGDSVRPIEQIHQLVISKMFSEFSMQ